MANIIDYLRWRGDLTFAQVPFNDVDSLVLCRLSYLPFEGVVPQELTAAPVCVAQAAEQVLAELSASAPTKQVRIKEDAVLLQELMRSPRFSGLGLAGYVNRLDRAQQKQFSATTILLPDGPFVAYRGTDGTLVGWKEDFNMSFDRAIPAQTDAAAYLAQAGAAFGGALRLGGHSKGGNLAVYAAAFCPPELQKRIVSVRNNDGPGFSAEVLSSPGYDAIAGRTHTYLPQSSVVGMLLEHEEAFTVVHSTYVGLAQHDVYSWEVLQNGFCTVESVTNSSQFMDRTLKSWLQQMAPAEREKLVDGVFSLIGSSSAVTLRDCWNGKNTLEILKAIGGADEETRHLVGEALEIFLHSAKQSLPTALEQWTKREKEN